MLALPLHDLPTRSSSGFLIRYILPRSTPPQLLGLTDRKVLFSTLTMGDLIIGTGHGSPSEFCGHANEVVMSTISVPDVKGKVVYLVSCETAKELGPTLVQLGALAFLGFLEDVIWICDADLTSTPWADKLAEPIMMPIVDSLNTILDGKSCGEAFQVLQDHFRDRLAVEQDEFMASLISWNLDSATLLGNTAAKVFQRPQLPPFFGLGPPPMIFPM